MLTMQSYSSNDVLREYPDVERILSYEIEEPSYARKFVSVFDGWLGEDHYHLLECRDEIERQERNNKLLSHWELIIDRTPVFFLNEKGHVHQSTDRHAFLAWCQYSDTKEDFAYVLLPAIGAYYKEDWEDTNVVWYSDRKKAQPLFDWANECGLHVLDDWRESID